MKREQIQAKIQFHTEEANRLLNAHPLVAEFHRHAQLIAECQQQLSTLDSSPAAAGVAEAPEKPSTRRKRRS